MANTTFSWQIKKAKLDGKSTEFLKIIKDIDWKCTCTSTYENKTFISFREGLHSLHHEDNDCVKDLNAKFRDVVEEDDILRYFFKKGLNKNLIESELESENNKKIENYINDSKNTLTF